MIRFSQHHPPGPAGVPHVSKLCPKIPSPNHWTKRRQQVPYDGNREGKSFQRAPLRSTHKIPSKHALALALGRPPCEPGGRSEKRPPISDHCSSASSGCRSLVSDSLLDPASMRDRFDIKSLLSIPMRTKGNRRLASKIEFCNCL